MSEALRVVENDDRAEWAEHEFQRMLKARRIRIRESEMNSKTLEDYQNARSIILEAILEGTLVVDEDGKTCTYTEQDNNRQITFYKCTGEVLAAMDRTKSDNQMAQTFLAIATLTKQPPTVLQKLDMVDLDVILALFTLFLNRLSR